MAKIKAILIFVGDIILLYIALLMTLLIRYGQNWSVSFRAHLEPFTIIFSVWLLIFYLADLYHTKIPKRGFAFFKNLATALVISVLVSTILFYLFTPLFGLTPKTNLVIFGLVFGTLDFIWRLLIANLLANYGRIKLLLLGESPSVKEIAENIKSYPQVGYDIAVWLKDYLKNWDLNELQNLIIKNKIDMIIFPPHLLKKETGTIKLIYKLLPLKIDVMNSAEFYEMLFQKAPLDEVKEDWFIEKITSRRRFYDGFKRIADFFLATLLIVIFSPFMILSAVLIKLSSKGPVFYKQKRTGENNLSFTIYKFRTMQTDNDGPLWTEKQDRRLTLIGKILRYTHLDETPQLLNIIKGDMSFVGPRPERTELADNYKQLPYYDIRHIIKPGLTGWAQLNYRPSASLKEAYEKLQYDIYYIENRSLTLDLLIMLKTIKYLVVSHG